MARRAAEPTDPASFAMRWTRVINAIPLHRHAQADEAGHGHSDGQMTPAAFRAIRRSLGLTAEAFAILLRVHGSRTIQKWESGERAVPGPVQVLATALRESPEVRRYFGIPLPDEAAADQALLAEDAGPE